MKEEEKILLQELCDQLQERMQYDNPWHAMDVLLYGWCKKRGHRTNWLSDVKRRGWLSQEMACDFAAYCGYISV